VLAVRLHSRRAAGLRRRALGAGDGPPPGRSARAG